MLQETVAGWFVQQDDVPFMMLVYQIRPDTRSQLHAVTHVDDSGPVNRHTNPRYHALNSAFRKLTVVPMALNTSFNENEPLVCNPELAHGLFLANEDGCAGDGWVAFAAAAGALSQAWGNGVAGGFHRVEGSSVSPSESGYLACRTPKRLAVQFILWAVFRASHDRNR